MVHKALNDGAGFAGARGGAGGGGGGGGGGCGCGGSGGAVGTVGAAVGLRAEDRGYRARLADVVAGLA